MNRCRSYWGRWDERSGRWKWTKRVRLVKKTRRPRELWHLFILELEGKLVQCSNANIASRCAPPIDKEAGIAISRPDIEPARMPRPHSLWSFLLAMTTDAWDAQLVNRRRTFHIGAASANCYRLLRWHQRTKSQGFRVTVHPNSVWHTWNKIKNPGIVSVICILNNLSARAPTGTVRSLERGKGIREHNIFGQREPSKKSRRRCYITFELV